MSKSIIILTIMILPSLATAGVIFETNFDTVPDWNSKESATGTDPGTIGWGVSKTLALQAPEGFSDHRAARGLLPATSHTTPPPYDNGKNTFQVNSTIKRGASGKSLQANYEMANNWVGGHVGKWLGTTGYDEIYVRWYRWFQPGWKYRTATGGVIHKWLRIMSNVDDPAGASSVDPTNMYLAPASRPDWLHNCPVENADNQCGKQAYLMLRDTQGPGRIPGVNEVYTSQLAYNPEGHAGTTQNDTYINFDNDVRLYWRDYHATQVTGNVGDFPWALSDSLGYDYQGNGEWVAYEIHAKMNDVGVANALVELFVNGEKVAQVSGFTLRTSAQTKFNYLMMPDNMDNEIYGSDLLAPPDGEQTFAIDDLVVSTNYIGPDYVVGGATNGICGSSNGIALSSAPITGLCSAGTASAVTGTGPWSWTCAGSGGGTTENCEASLLEVPPTGNASTMVACPAIAGFR